MLDVGFSELLVFGIITLLVLGPEKLPEAARFAAKWYSKFKQAITSVQNDIDRELRLSEFREQMQKEMQRIQELEQKMQTQMNALQQQSIFIAEQAQKSVNTNKNSSRIFTHLVGTIPTTHYPEVWLKQCDDVVIPKIIAFEIVTESKLKVAV